MEPLFIALIVAAFALAKWALKQADTSGETRNDPAAPPPVPRAPQARRQTPMYADEEERLRKFLEALGVPSGSAPPPPVTPRPATPQRPLAPVRPPVVGGLGMPRRPARRT